MNGWIGVDLDRTLARYESWGDGSIGEPIPEMVDRVKMWLSQGIEVKIFTARVSPNGRGNDDGTTPSYYAEIDRQIGLITAWCKKYIGCELPITYMKDFAMTELWDDRAIQVIPNDGRTLMQADPRSSLSAADFEQAAAIINPDAENPYQAEPDVMRRVANTLLTTARLIREGR